ncbi:MAG: DUF454 family protein [Peptostreptococcaceae bacterium]
MKQILAIIGILSTMLGFIGVFLPILPTTPLLLLALYCFSRSSKKFENWLINSDLYKKYLEDFVTYKRMKLSRKIVLLSFATTMMLFPIVILDSYLIKIFIMIMMIYLYYYFIFCIKIEE